MNEEDYACDKFVGQRFKRDICKVCYQPKRLHELKSKKNKTNDQKIAAKESGGVSTADHTKPTSRTDALANTRHTEHENPRKEDNSRVKVASVTQETQLHSEGQQCTTISDINPQVDDKTLVDVLSDKQDTTDDLCASSNIDRVKHDDEVVGGQVENNNANSNDSGERKNEENAVEIPLNNNSDGTNVPSRDIATSLSARDDEIAREMHGESTGSEATKDVTLLPDSVKELDALHVEELPDKSCSEKSEDEGTNKETAASSASLVEGKTDVESSHIEELPGESGEDTHTTFIQVSTPPSSADTKQQLDMEENYKTIVSDNGQLESAEVELSQSASSLVTNDPASSPPPPVGNPVPPMVVDNQGSNIPVPPPPPPIRAPPPPPSPDKEPPPHSPPASVPSAEMLSSPQVSYIILKIVRT